MKALHSLFGALIPVFGVTMVVGILACAIAMNDGANIAWAFGASDQNIQATVRWVMVHFGAAAGIGLVGLIGSAIIHSNLEDRLKRQAQPRSAARRRFQ